MGIIPIGVFIFDYLCHSHHAGSSVGLPLKVHFTVRLRAMPSVVVIADNVESVSLFVWRMYNVTIFV